MIVQILGESRESGTGLKSALVIKYHPTLAGGTHDVGDGTGEGAGLDGVFGVDGLEGGNEGGENFADVFGAGVEVISLEVGDGNEDWRGGDAGQGEKRVGT